MFLLISETFIKHCHGQCWSSHRFICSSLDHRQNMTCILNLHLKKKTKKKPKKKICISSPFPAHPHSQGRSASLPPTLASPLPLKGLALSELWSSVALLKLWLGIARSAFSFKTSQKSRLICEKQFRFYFIYLFILKTKQNKKSTLLNQTNTWVGYI